MPVYPTTTPSPWLRRPLFKSFVVICFIAISLTPLFGESQESNFVTLQLFSQEEPTHIRLHAPGGIFLQTGEQKNHPLHTTTLDLEIASGKLQSHPAFTTTKEPWIIKTSGNEPLVVTSEQGRIRRLQTPLKVSVKSHRLFLSTRIPLEDYVTQVLPEEMPRDFPLEALKAQAVLIRTRALQKHFEHRREAYDICDSTHCQVWKGVKPFDAKIQAATQQTRGKILAYRNQIIQVLYHSSCGGYTAANHQVFGGKPLPYLQGVSDENFCANSPQSTWNSRLNWKQLQTALEENRLSGITLSNKDAHGRILDLRLVNGSHAVISAQELMLRLGRLYGWDTLKSNRFDLSFEKDTLVFSGHGLGHGVGLCQWGARGRAQQGASFEQILKAYFPGTHLQVLAQK